ncbi:MAG TPA: HEAT repeat domain-containing protein [Humisphaera sp.]|nr:HEAT repeat domain-containing protein [Humisphaera sp.]
MRTNLIVLSLTVSAMCGCQSTRVRPTVPASPQPHAVALDEGLSAAAKTMLADALVSPDTEVRVHAIEAIRLTDPQEHNADILRALRDPQPQVRFAGALASGDLRLQEARPILLQMADDSSENVRVAVRYALHRLGDTHLSHDLEVMARSTNPMVRGNTAMVLGMLGEPSALRILRVMRLDANPAVRQQASEAMWKLHDQTGLEDLIALSLSSHPDDQMLGLIGLAEPRDVRVRQHVRNGLTADYPEVTLVAARAMGMLGSDEGYGLALRGINSTDQRQRQLAAFAIGAIGRPDAQTPLRKLMADPAPDVRLAAATALLQLKPTAVAQR